MKTTMSEMNNSQAGINGRPDMAEKRLVNVKTEQKELFETAYTEITLFPQNKT